MKKRIHEERTLVVRETTNVDTGRRYFKMVAYAEDEDSAIEALRHLQDYQTTTIHGYWLEVTYRLMTPSEYAQAQIDALQSNNGFFDADDEDDEDDDFLD